MNQLSKYLVGLTAIIAVVIVGGLTISSHSFTNGSASIFGSSTAITRNGASQSQLNQWVITQSATNITQTSATIGVLVKSQFPAYGYSPFYVQFFMGKSFPLSTAASQLEYQSTAHDVVYSHNVSGLTPNTTYYFSANAWNPDGTGHGTTLAFTTKAATIIPVLTKLVLPSSK